MPFMHGVILMKLHKHVYHDESECHEQEPGPRSRSHLEVKGQNQVLLYPEHNFFMHGSILIKLHTSDHHNEAVCHAHEPGQISSSH